MARAAMDRTPKTEANAEGAALEPARAREVPQEADELVLFNSADPGDRITYRLDGQVYSLEPGKTMSLPVERAKIIEFERGGSFGSARYRVTQGTYRFAQTDRGRELYRRAVR
ncbi:MAG: hypothetical protein HY000_36710 [Planctomycetes bacterium]|nr:hypothetical protein [Planctomycetota bacterium]